MTEGSDPGMRARLLRSIAMVCGGLLALYAVVYGLVAMELAAGGHTDGSLCQVASTRSVLLFLGIATIVLGVIGGRVWQRAPGWLLPAWLLIWTSLLPLSVLEISLRPFHPGFEDRAGGTALFVGDERLGWRLRPNVKARWCDREVSVNAKGTVGPEVPYVREPGVRRILFLGDSVTFGYCLDDWDQAFPHRTAVLLERSLGVSVESVNSGVGGYSPWQEYLYLEDEGMRYSPDLVVVGFVQNDFAEKLDLVRFGGTGEGSQLVRTTLTRFEALSRRSALVYFARRLGGRLRFGADSRQGAMAHEADQVRSLRGDGDARYIDLIVELTLKNLQRIVDLCQSHDVPMLLAIFPFRSQLEEPAASSPPTTSRLLLEFARSNNIHVIDVETAMRERAIGEGLEPADYMLDESHPSQRGHGLVAQTLAVYIAREEILSRVGDGSSESPHR